MPKLPVTNDVPITLEEDETIKLPVTNEEPTTLKLPETFVIGSPPLYSTLRASFLLLWSVPAPTTK